ncbi:hypothetical protein [Microbulbifer hainanensis]|uniref:hypothetical protein n=1 Tax=Microbulbifer hainanensis TaxID=2735675 RepID=UPI0018688471|nr:hypothetical protein [Microbulbifer hainanensis]
MVNFWLAEVLLALSAFLVASQYWYIARDRCQSPALLIVAGMVFLAFAALAGAYRYGVDPHTTDLHRILSRLSGYVTFLSVGIALLWARLRLPMGYASRAPAYVTLVLIIGIALGADEQFATAGAGRLLSTLGLLLWLGVALAELIAGRYLSRKMAVALAVGAALVVFAGLVVGSSATRSFGLARMNWFHLMLALGSLLLLCGRPLFAEGEKIDE